MFIVFSYPSYHPSPPSIIPKIVDMIAAAKSIYNIVSPKHSTINFHRGVSFFTTGILAPKRPLNSAA